MDQIRHLQNICIIVQAGAIDPELLKIAGQIAGIGGIAIGALIILFRDIIRKNIFPGLVKQQAYRLLILIVVLVWSVAIAGIAAWVFVNSNQRGNVAENTNTPRTTKEFQLSGLVRDEEGKGIAGADISVIGGTERDETTSNGSFRLIIKRDRGEAIRLRAAKKGYHSWDENVEIPNTNLIITLKATGEKPPPANQSLQTPTAQPSISPGKNSSTSSTLGGSTSRRSEGNVASDLLKRRMRTLDKINKNSTPQP